jgi:hypothetical protein
VIPEYYVPVSGPSTPIPLNYLSVQELIEQNLSEQEILYKIGHDNRRNHLNKENNRSMANLIIDVIQNDAFDAYEIKMQDYFEVLR